LAAALNLYMPVPMEVVLVTRETSDTRTFRCQPVDGGRVAFAPGQFMILSILGVGECPISIASSPLDGPWVELTVRNVGRVTAALHLGPPKGSLGLRGPLGNGFNLDRLKGRPLVLAAGGIGLAPLRSLIRFVHAAGEGFGPMTVLYGARTPDERLYRDELESWRRAPGTRVFEIVERDPAAAWTGPTGRVPDLFGRLGRLEGAAAVVCGPPPMIAPVVSSLEKAGVTAADIQVAVEGRMSCGIGKCGHCYIGDALVCTDGPVFTAQRLRSLGGL
jgi:NAD(P)H-flavin reductase